MASPKEQHDELAPNQTEDAKQTVAAEAAQLATDLSAELIWDGEHAYVVALEAGHVRTLAVESRAFQRWVISKCRANGNRAPSNAQQWSALRILIESIAEEGGIKNAPAIRVAGKWPVVFIDLGDEKWNCVRVTSEGWEVVPHPADGPYFYRPSRMAALPVPERGGDIEDLWEVLNAVDPAEQKLLPVWIVQALWPKGPYPILTVHGPHGSTKTTRVSVAKALTDPTFSSEEIPAVTSPRKPPRDERSIIAAARNNRVVAFDNVSYLDQWLSDGLCRLATGAELGDRGLYTDFDEAVFAACRPILLNGIPDVVGQSDLADRCIQTEAKKPAQRKSEVEFWRGFETAWPSLLGVVLDLLSDALRHWTEAAERVTEDVRMGNFARIGEAIGIELGWAPGEFTATYAANLRSAATEIAQADAIYAPLLWILRESGGSWTGTMGELLTGLNASLSNALDFVTAAEVRKSREWPRSAKALSNKLTRLAPALEHDGVTIGDAVRSHGRTTRTITASGAHTPLAQSAPTEPAEGAT